ncbi:hypothetical protein lmo4a_1285 [Listeria monocytogenes L99]|nr:hypothetical protein lmo4a_1285 [Listeria monocytogenes L99]
MEENKNQDIYTLIEKLENLLKLQNNWYSIR